jgi:hypothetical protein
MGFPQAFYNLGCVHENGVLGKKNMTEALINFYKGGVRGDIQSRLKFAYQLMNHTFIYREEYIDHYRVARRWLESIIHKLSIIDDNGPATSRIRIHHTSLHKA